MSLSSCLQVYIRYLKIFVESNFHTVVEIYFKLFAVTLQFDDASAGVMTFDVAADGRRNKCRRY